MEAEGQVLRHQPGHAGGRHAELLDRHGSARRRQGMRPRLRRDPRQEVREAAPRLPCRHEALPVGHGELGRSQRPRDKDRGGDDHPRARLAADHQPRAERQHAGLQHHAEDLRRRAESAGPVRDPLVGGDEGVVGLAPAPAEAVLHSKRRQDLRVSPPRLGEAGAGLGVGGGGRVGTRVVISVARVKATSTRPPARAATPISGWNRKQFAR